MTVQELYVAGYRSIREMTLPLAQVNVIVGPNGVGKTNLYRTMVLLGSAASGTFASTLAEEGGMPSVLWAGQRSKGPVRMALRVRMDQLVYELQCGLTPPPGGPFELDPDIKEENLWLLDKRRRLPMLERAAGSAFARDADGHRVTFPFSLWGSESVLAQVVEPHRFPLLSAVRQQLMNFRFYHHFRTDSGAPLRVEQVGVRTPVLSTDGHDLAAALATILDIGDKGALKDAVSSAFPGASLEVSSRQGRFRVELGLPGMSRPLDAREFSDGTARYLCLLAALLSPRPPLLLALNEPETSLHPDLVGPLGDLLVHAASRSQLWITTHSRPLAERLRKATPCWLIELGKNGGETVLARAAVEDDE